MLSLKKKGKNADGTVTGRGGNIKAEEFINCPMCVISLYRIQREITQSALP